MPLKIPGRNLDRRPARSRPRRRNKTHWPISYDSSMPKKSRPDSNRINNKIYFNQPTQVNLPTQIYRPIQINGQIEINWLMEINRPIQINRAIETNWLIKIDRLYASQYKDRRALRTSMICAKIVKIIYSSWIN